MVKDMLESNALRVSWNFTYGVFLNYDKTVVYVTFPDVWRCCRGGDCRFFNYSHTKISDDGANWAPHCTSMYLFVDRIVKHKVVVREGEFQEGDDFVRYLSPMKPRTMAKFPFQTP